MSKPAQPFGELALIQQIRRDFPARRRGVVLGIGDDGAILRPSEGSELIVTTDFTLEGRHFRRDLHPPQSVGHRCLARGLSDLAAMGATPLAAFLSLALPALTLRTASGRRWVSEFFSGLSHLAARYQVQLAGGDTAEAPDSSILADITLVGTAAKGRALRRSGARPGDQLYVTGALGGATAELDEMMARGTLPSQRALQGEHPQIFPQPRIAVGKFLLSHSIAAACIDLSDGLSTDLAHLCEESGVGAQVERAALPLHLRTSRLGTRRAIQAALDGGEDYELLFAARPGLRVPRSIAGVKVTRIGHVTTQAAGVNLLRPNGLAEPLEARGWQHFAPSQQGRQRR